MMSGFSLSIFHWLRFLSGRACLFLVCQDQKTTLWRYHQHQASLLWSVANVPLGEIKAKILSSLAIYPGYGVFMFAQTLEEKWVENPTFSLKNVLNRMRSTHQADEGHESIKISGFRFLGGGAKTLYVPVDKDIKALRAFLVEKKSFFGLQSLTVLALKLAEKKFGERSAFFWAHIDSNHLLSVLRFKGAFGYVRLAKLPQDETNLINHVRDTAKHALETCHLVFSENWPCYLSFQQRAAQKVFLKEKSFTKLPEATSFVGLPLGKHLPLRCLINALWQRSPKTRFRFKSIWHLISLKSVWQKGFFLVVGLSFFVWHHHQKMGWMCCHLSSQIKEREVEIAQYPLSFSDFQKTLYALSAPHPLACVKKMAPLLTKHFRLKSFDWRLKDQKQQSLQLIFVASKKGSSLEKAAFFETFLRQLAKKMPHVRVDVLSEPDQSYQDSVRSRTQMRTSENQWVLNLSWSKDGVL